MLKENLVRKKTGLAEQSISWNLGKEDFMTFGRRGRQLSRTTKML